MLHMVRSFWGVVPLGCLLTVLLAGPAPAVEQGAGTPTNKGTAAPASGAGKGGTKWGFGVSRDRASALWRDGVETESLRRRALGLDKGNAASIENALREADRQARKESRKAREAERAAEEKSRVGVNIRRDDSVWRQDLPSDERRPDELRPLERRHVVRAYADFMDSNDASLTIGPELMLKDDYSERDRKEGERPENSDPSLGLGMQFSLDF